MVYDRNLEEIDTRTVRGLARTKKVKCFRLKGIRKIGDFPSNNRFSRKRTWHLQLLSRLKYFC